MKALLTIEALTIKLNSKTLVDNINFTIFPGKTFALLGNSGSGKSMTALSIMRLLPQALHYSKDSKILFEGTDLLSLPERDMRSIRGGKIAMIFQEPSTSLNPVLTIEEQIRETIKAHQKLTSKEIKLKILTLLEDVQLKDSERILKSYPHQLSGGMKQRIMIAMSLAGNPKLLIADEPTTALDVTIQAQIIQLLKNLQRQYGLSILYITHDLALAAQMADSIGVLYQGQLVEHGSVEAVLKHPKHPFTQQLISSLHKLVKPVSQEEAVNVLSIEDLKVYFPIKQGFFNRTVGVIKAVDSISLNLKEGQTLALVGESGSGKTTVAKSVMSLLKPNSGNINLLGKSLIGLNARQLRSFRSEYQMIFQDPFSAMDPRLLIKDILAEGMLSLNIGTNESERLDRMDVLLQQVGLLPEHKYRYPHEFSGGQRQRICIARALLVGPRLLVCDEPTSSLDLLVQAEIIDLLIQLQHEFELSYLLITHNFTVVRAMAHTIAVMQNGKIVEQGYADDVLNNPKHSYTKKLLEAVPNF